MGKDTYKELLKDPRWQYVRGRILERDKWRCCHCRSDRNLQVHHKKYDFKWLPWEYPDEYLLTLCDKCHKDAHGIVESDDGQDMRNPFVRLKQFVKDWKGLVASMMAKNTEKKQEEHEDG